MYYTPPPPRTRGRKCRSRYVLKSCGRGMENQAINEELETGKKREAGGPERQLKRRMFMLIFKHKERTLHALQEQP